MEQPAGSETCVACGAAQAGSELDFPAATAADPPDLDLRPAGATSFELGGWVRCCASCGYANTRLDQPPDATRGSEDLGRQVADEAYQRTLHDPRFPALANLFRCQALLQAEADTPASRDLAALSLLYAAWVCDDHAAALAGEDAAVHPAQAAALARQLRRQAAERMRETIEGDRPVVEDAATSWLVLADVYRRAELFPSAHTAAIRGLAQAPSDSALAWLLEFEQRLIEAQDVSAASMAAAFDSAI